MLLKVVRFAYSQGIVRSRAIERVCQEHVTFIALCGMSAPRNAASETHTMRMQHRLDTPAVPEQYGQRFGTVEPMFGNLRYNKRLDRFTWRGRTKINGQWLLFCLVHSFDRYVTQFDDDVFRLCCW